MTPSDMIGHSFPTLEEKPYIPTMPKNRIIPATVLAVALSGLFQTHGQPLQPGPAAAGGPPAGAGVGVGAVAKPAAPAPPTDAEKLLDEAIAKVKAIDSVMAEILQKVDMLGQKFEIKGSYRKAPKDRLFLKLEVHNLADASGLMQQVCDGSSFWEHQKVFETQIYRKLDAGAILAKMRGIDLDEEIREKSWSNSGSPALKPSWSDSARPSPSTRRPKGLWMGGRSGSCAGTGPTAKDSSPPTCSLSVRPCSSRRTCPAWSRFTLGEDDYWPYKVMLVSQQPSPS